MSYFAAGLARTASGWTGVELDLDEVEDLEALTDLLRDLTDDGPGPALLLLEENDEYAAIVRVDGGAGSLEEARVFLSDRRAVLGSEVAAMLWEDDEPVAEDSDEESGTVLSEPVGEAGLLADLGTPGDALLELCAEEGLLPADVLSRVCESAGCGDVLESLREV